MGVYTRETWQARAGTKLNRFTKSGETTASVELTNNPESITQAGTEFTADRMNNIESGIVKAVAQVDADETGSVTAHTIDDNFLTTCLYSGAVTVPASLSVGTRKRIRNVASSGDVSITFSGSETLLSGNTSFSISPAGWVDLEKISTTEWIITAGAKALRVIDTTGSITLDDMPKQVIEVDTSLGSVTATLSDGAFVGQEIIIQCSGSGLAYVKGTGVYNGASSLGTPISDGLAWRATWDGSKWVPVNEVTANYVSGGTVVKQTSKGQIEYQYNGQSIPYSASDTLEVSISLPVNTTNADYEVNYDCETRTGINISTYGSGQYITEVKSTSGFTHRFYGGIYSAGNSLNGTMTVSGGMY